MDTVDALIKALVSLIKPQLVGLASVVYVILKGEWSGLIAELMLLRGFISRPVVQGTVEWM